MKATFDGQDYMLILDKKTQEFQGLREGKLEAPLTGHWDDKDLGKYNGSDKIEIFNGDPRFDF